MPKLSSPSSVGRALTASVLVTLGAVACCASGCSSNDPGPWTLVWSDEFDGTSLDASKWSHQIGKNFGTNQSDYDTARPENVSLDGQGMLVITAIKEAYLGATHTSGRITTAGKFARTYGKFEARMKLPQGQGMWPAFWLVGANIGNGQNGTVPWPDCGEIDIMENKGANVRTTYASLHGRNYSGGDALGGLSTLPVGQSYADDFHVFGMEWEEDEIRFYRDGIPLEKGTFEAGKLRRDQPWAFDHDFQIIVNLAVGGNFVGDIGADTVFPQSLLVDYVRVYAR